LSSLRKLASQTAVYGLSSIIGRILGYLLVPIHTRVLNEAAYGSVVEFYSYVALFLIILTYGLETAFFRFSESTGRRQAVMSTSFLSILFSSVVFLILIFIFKTPLAELIRYPDHSEYIIYIGIILFFDAINTIPFANLRAENKAIKFVIIRLTGIFVNIGMNLILLLLVPYLAKSGNGPIGKMIADFYKPEDLVYYIFASNLVSSAIMTILFLPDFFRIKLIFDKVLWRKMMLYSLPLLVFGLAGVINEVIDRILLKYLLPPDIAMEQLGIYGAIYKVSIIMTIFIQAYRYAAEPFFFAQHKDKNAPQTYATLMTWFVITTSLIFLVTMLYMDIIIHFVDEPFRVGANVIPILLLANMFLGIYYNLSVWYKLTDKTRFGAYISIFGAIITLGLNIYWIPRIGYLGSAWATLICYGSMMIISWYLGRKYYSIPYDILSISVIIAVSIAFYQISLLIAVENLYLKLAINTLLFFGYILFLFFYKKPMIKTLINRR
jgi:O-antigen/teichoic acid export membrane protein